MIILCYYLFFSFIFIYCKADDSRQKLTGIGNGKLCDCKKNKDFIPRIVGGEDADPHEYPWMAAIFSDGRLYCGGSLINDRYILTAGHCCRWTAASQITVALGLHNRILFERYKRGGTLIGAQSVIVHEKFISKKYHDSQDIALIKLKRPVKFTENIKPVCLPSNPDNDYSEKIAQITGWGRMSSSGSRSKSLKEANVTIISNKECKKNPEIGKYIEENMLCAYELRVDACQGDSGGPLFYETPTGRVEQVGIVSWGIGCAEPGIPGVYTRVTSYLDWIASHTKDATYCGKQ